MNFGHLWIIRKLYTVFLPEEHDGYSICTWFPMFLFSRFATLHSIRVTDFDNYLASLRYQCWGHTIILPYRIHVYLCYCVTIKLAGCGQSKCSFPTTSSPYMRTRVPMHALLMHTLPWPSWASALRHNESLNSYDAGRVHADYHCGWYWYLWFKTHLVPMIQNTSGTYDSKHILCDLLWQNLSHVAKKWKLSFCNFSNLHYMRFNTLHRSSKYFENLQFGSQRKLGTVMHFLIRLKYYILLGNIICDMRLVLPNIEWKYTTTLQLLTFYFRPILKPYYPRLAWVDWGRSGVAWRSDILPQVTWMIDRGNTKLKLCVRHKSSMIVKDGFLLFLTQILRSILLVDVHLSLVKITKHNYIKWSNEDYCK
jgi:hypothetical protein